MGLSECVAAFSCYKQAKNFKSVFQNFFFVMTLYLNLLILPTTFLSMTCQVKDFTLIDIVSIDRLGPVPMLKRTISKCTQNEQFYTINKPKSHTILLKLTKLTRK